MAIRTALLTLLVLACTIVCTQGAREQKHLGARLTLPVAAGNAKVNVSGRQPAERETMKPGYPMGTFITEKAPASPPLSPGAQAALPESRNIYQELSPQVRAVLDFTEKESEREADHSFMGLLRQTLTDIGGGTGATVGNTGSSVIDRDLVRRMHNQDTVVMVLLLTVYVCALVFCAAMEYCQSFNNSPITFYADPRFHIATASSHDLDEFLTAFNTAPREMHLQVTGLSPASPFAAQAVGDWGSHHHVAFSFGLDLSPWIVPDGASPGFISAEAETELGVTSAVGVNEEDLEKLRLFLGQNRNDLAMVELVKEVSWPEWEELAINIKQRIRQAGFDGTIQVRRGDQEVMTIFKNRPWANFLHSRTTKVLVMLSVVGWLIYQPYMMIRTRSIRVAARFRIDMPIDHYWTLISDKIGPNGFDPQGIQRQ